MPIVHIDVLDGRTVEEKREMVKQVTDAIVNSLNVPPDAVTVIINDMPHHNFAKAGVLRSDRK
ncbi:MAG TPA: 2-hydroxymuconate tautomerase family protein [Firmicutes bacterium]|nr:2-hydroxymuconate tautomerase family protein [Candidatus Fermentithermobacillaceae bacterium]